MHPPLEGQWSHLCLSPSCWNLVQNSLCAQGLYFCLKRNWKHWIDNRITIKLRTITKFTKRKLRSGSHLSRTLWTPAWSVQPQHRIVRTGYMYSAGCCCHFVCFVSLYKTSPVTNLFKRRRILLAIKAIFHSKGFAPRFVLKQNRNYKNSEIACWLHISIFCSNSNWHKLACLPASFINSSKSPSYDWFPATLVLRPLSFASVMICWHSWSDRKSGISKSN